MEYCEHENMEISKLDVLGMYMKYPYSGSQKSVTFD